MFIETKKTAVFRGTVTTEEERTILRTAGFIHLTGLPVKWPHHRGNDNYVIGERQQPNELGKWDTNNGKFVLITTGGEVWMRSTTNAGSLEEIKRRFAPNGRGAFVPLSNGDEVEQYMLFERAVDPNFEFVVSWAKK